MFKLLLALSVLGTLLNVPMQFKALLIPFFVFPVSKSWEVIQENAGKGTLYEELEKEKAQLYGVVQQEVDEFNKQKTEFLEEFDKQIKEKLAYLEEEKSIYQKEYERLVAEANSEIERLAADWEQEKEETIKAHQEELERIHLEYTAHIEQLENQIQNLTIRVEYYEALPKYCPKHYGKVSDEINSLIDELFKKTELSKVAMAQHPTVFTCDYVGHKIDPDHKVLQVWLEPKDRDATKKIIQLKDELTVFNYEHVDITPARGALRFTLQNEIYDEALTEDIDKLEAQLVAPDPRLVKTVFRDFVHCFIWGNTGTGKSTLISNVMNLIDYLNIQDGMVTDEDSVTLFDPKFPHSQLDSENYLKLEGIPVTWSKWESLYNVCIDLLYMIDDRLDMHYEEAIALLESGNRQALSKLQVATFILDELEIALKDAPLNLGDAYDEGLLGVEQVTKYNFLLNKPGRNYQTYIASDVLSRVLKVARSSKVRLIGVGQSPMPSHYDLLKIDFLNCTRIWLGDVAETIVLGRGSEFVNMTNEDKRLIRKQVTLRKQINKLRFSQGRDPIRYMVVHSPGLPVFIMDSPGVDALVKDLYGVEHKFFLPNRLPKDAYGSDSARELKVKPDPVDIPKHSDRDQLVKQFNQLLEISLTEQQEKLRAYLQKYSDQEFTIAKLKDRLKWFKALDDQQIRVDVAALEKAKYIQLVPGKPAKIKYNEA